MEKINEQVPQHYVEIEKGNITIMDSKLNEMTN